MAISHIASIRGSARMAQQQRAASASAIQDNSDGDNYTSSGRFNERADEHPQSIEQQSAQLLALSISDDDNLSTGPNLAGAQHGRRNQVTLANRHPPPMEMLTSISDIESHLESELHQINTLHRLEQKWIEITKNFSQVVMHLSVSSNQVNQASRDCLQSLLENVETTCDKVDNELKAMYHLMTKCDELTTKLSIATSFRDEIKTLRKSVETLEQLFKNKSQYELQKSRNLN